jgi:hypothetical protein
MVIARIRRRSVLNAGGGVGGIGRVVFIVVLKSILTRFLGAAMNYNGVEES